MTSYNIPKMRQFFNSRVLTDQRDGICWCWNKQANDFNWLNKTETTIQFKFFKKMGYEVVECNNTEFEDINGKMWYGLTIQSEGDSSIDAGAMSVAGFMVSGCCYWFQNKTNRDTMFKWLSDKRKSKK